MDELSQVREFWDEFPCDGHASFELRSRFRYRKDPWLLPFLDRIAGGYRHVLEVGCGQGTDGISLCQRLLPGSCYVGVDRSQTSLERADGAAAEVRESLKVFPEFRLGNAEQLDFPDGSFECVFSVGALHHSERTERAIAEVHRVLAPGGVALVLLYRRSAPKVLAAHMLRAFQDCLDAGLRKDRIIYRAWRAVRTGNPSGTAIEECFGVPILRSYTRRGMSSLFRKFSSVRLSSRGFGSIFRTKTNPEASAPLGYLWLAEAIK